MINGYELVDFGHGRKLERFAGVTVDRPSPAAERAVPQHPELWNEPAARYERSEAGQRAWRSTLPLPDPWAVQLGRLTFELRTTAAGQVGLFPEQIANWDWLAGRLSASRQAGGQTKQVLNLFAYTGGSTLAAAATGAAVVHVDAARSAVAWARRNAAASGLSEAPIRWIVDDARKFAAQERKRGKHYDGVILDPPSYGHGSGGEAWKLERDLEPLLADCAALTGPNPGFMLLSCHAPGYGAEELAALLRRWFPHAKMDADDMHLATDDGHLLHSGARSRFAASES